MKITIRNARILRVFNFIDCSLPGHKPKVTLPLHMWVWNFLLAIRYGWKDRYK